MDKHRLLVVEDQAIIALDLTSRLTQLGYQVVGVVASGAEAVQQAILLQPDLILMDIQLQGDLDGIQATEQIRAQADLPVIYLTAHSDERTLQRARLTEPYGYVLKPFEDRELHMAIEIALYKYTSELKLRAHERWLAATLKGIGEAVIATDARQRIQFINPVAEALTGWAQAEAVGQAEADVLRLVDDSGLPTRESPLARVVQEGGATVRRQNAQVITREGRIIPVDSSAAPIYDEHGAVLGGVWVARDVSERQQANQALRLSHARLAEANRRVTALSRIAAHLTGQPNVAEMVASLGAELLGLGVNCLVALLDETTQALVVRDLSLPPAVMALAAQSIHTHLRGLRITGDRLPASVAAALFQRRTAVFDAAPTVIAKLLVQKLALPFDEQVLAAAGLGPNARAISAPLNIAGQMQGVLLMWGPTLQETDVAAYAAFGDHVAAALYQSRLLEAEQEQRRLAESLRDTAIKVHSALSINTVLDHVLDNVESVVPYDAVGLIWVDVADGIARAMRYRSTAARERAPDWLGRPLPMAMNATWRRLVEAREPLVVPDLHAHSAWADFVRPEWARSLVSVPIRTQERLLGALNLYSAQSGFFTPAHIHNAQILADQAALALTHAQLFQAEQLQRRNALALQQLTQAVIGTRLDLEAGLLAIVQSLARSPGYPLIQAVVLIDGRAQPVAQHGYAPDGPIQPPTSQLEIIERVLRGGQPVFIPNAPAGPEQRAAPTGVRSLIVVPLMPDGPLAGALAVATHGDRVLDRSDFEWLMDVSRSVSVALDNARLYANLQGLLEERELTRATLNHTEKMMALGRLSASFTHEINNPLQAVQGCLTLAREELSADLRRDTLDRYLGVAEVEMARVTALVQRMRDFYRPQRAERKPTDVHAVLEATLELAAKQLQQRGITIVREWAPNLPEITADANELKQVFLNLVLNAIDAMPRGGELSIRTALAFQSASQTASLSTTALRLRPPMVRLRFTDTGLGIPPDVLAHLFEPFITSKDHGSGLGLYTSYNILQGYSASITADSEPGRGTTFTILFPSHPPALADPAGTAVQS